MTRVHICNNNRQQNRRQHVKSVAEITTVDLGIRPHDQTSDFIILGPATGTGGKL